MKIFVLVDWWNFFKSCTDLSISPDQAMTAIRRMVLEKGFLKEIRLFVPSFLQPYEEPWKLLNQLQHRHGFKIDVCPVLREGPEIHDEGRFKDIVDFEALKYLLEWIHAGDDIDLVALVAGDGHFLTSYHALSNMGKMPKFWLVDRSIASGVIVRELDFEVIELAGRPIIQEAEKNPFVSAMSMAQKGTLSEENRQKISNLQRIADELASLQNTNIGSGIDAIVSKLQASLSSALSLPEKEVRDAIIALIATGEAQLVPASVGEIQIDPASLFFQRLENSG